MPLCQACRGLAHLTGGAGFGTTFSQTENICWFSPSRRCRSSFCPATRLFWPSSIRLSLPSRATSVPAAFRRMVETPITTEARLTRTELSCSAGHKVLLSVVLFCVALAEVFFTVEDWALPFQGDGRHTTGTEVRRQACGPSTKLGCAVSVRAAILPAAGI